MPEARNITMEKRQISFSPPDITEAEVSAVADALRSGLDHNRSKNQGV